MLRRIPNKLTKYQFWWHFEFFFLRVLPQELGNSTIRPQGCCWIIQKGSNLENVNFQSIKRIMDIETSFQKTNVWKILLGRFLASRAKTVDSHAAWQKSLIFAKNERKKVTDYTIYTRMNIFKNTNNRENLKH